MYTQLSGLDMYVCVLQWMTSRFVISTSGPLVELKSLLHGIHQSMAYPS